MNWAGTCTVNQEPEHAGHTVPATPVVLRGVDVRRLEFADFDWPGNRLLVTQAKTGRRVQLPLLKEVGWAVIDYIRHGRPACDFPQVSVRHLAPIGPFSDQDHLHQILVNDVVHGSPRPK